MIQVIPTTGVFQYEPFGFTNCTRYRDVLYLSGISAVPVLMDAFPFAGRRCERMTNAVLQRLTIFE